MDKVYLIKLFEMQNVLRDHIGYDGEDKKEKMLLALLVEVAECANEWRGFKYWSKDQEPRIKVPSEFAYPVVYKNLLLEEYVDGLHFVLDYGLEIGIDPERVDIREYGLNGTITKAFLTVQELALELQRGSNDFYTRMGYDFLISHYLNLGQKLGFSEKDIFYAYVEKNKVNHQRQESGY